MRLTRQGIRDLNPPGHNGHRNHGVSCRHFFGGPLVVIGHSLEIDPLDGQAHRAEVYGRRCLWCGEARDDR